MNVKYAFNFGFTLIQCERCGSKGRAAGSPCPDCGFEGRKDEVNAMLTRRRQGVKAVQALVADAKPFEAHGLPYFATRDAWPDRLNHSFRSVLESLQHFVAEPMAINRQTSLARAFTELELVAEEFDAIPLRRPHVQELRARKRAVQSMRRVPTLYLESFCAATPGEAQRLGERAQVEIEASEAAFDASNAAGEMRVRLSSVSEEDLLAGAIETLAVEFPGSLLDADERIALLLRGRLGRAVAFGQGANYGVASVLAKAYLDVDRFDALISEASHLVETQGTLLAISEEPQALDLLRRARNAIVDSTLSFSVALQRAKTDEARLRRVVNLYGELFEDGAAPLFSWYLRIAGAKTAPVSRLMQADASELLRSVSSNPTLAGLFLGANDTVRHAASHGLSYELRGDDVHFSLRSFKGTMSVEVLVDLLLALLESLLAAFWVLDNELAAVGAQGHTADMTLMGVSMLAIGELVLGALGAEVVAAEEREGAWRFELSSAGRVDPFLLATSLAANLPPEIRSVSLEYPHLEDRELVISEATAERFRGFKDLDGLPLIRQNLEFLNESRLDGLTALTVEHLESTANIGALALLLKDDRDAVPLLRRCRILASNVGALAVVKFIDAVLSEWRSTEARRLADLKKTMLIFADLPAPTLPKVRRTVVDRIRRSATTQS